MSAKPSKITSQVSYLVDDIPVEGTYTSPATAGPFPAIVMVAGSGPTDRNWNSPLLPGTNGSGALLADVFTDAGFATLRYDKRASGPHVQENILRLQGRVSMQSHLDELSGAVHWLAARPEIDARRIFGFGNSEGCIHVMNYQLNGGQPGFAGLVLTAPPANPVGKVAHNQVAAQLAALPDGEAWLAAYDRAIEEFVAGRPAAMDESAPEGLRNLILAVTTPVNQPFSRELWVLDPLSLLSKIAAPVLIVIGKKDLQVSWQTEGSVFEALAAHQQNITLAFPPDANHVLKHEPKALQDLTPVEVMAGYSSDSTALDPGALQIIRSWLAERM